MSQQQTVLVAEDDAAVRLIVSQTLTSAGYAVRATPSIEALEKWVTDGLGDVVVTDVHLGDDSVFDRLSSLKRSRPELPFIVMSGNNTILTAASAADHGAFDYLPKPFDIDELSALVSRAIQSRPKGRGASREARAALEASGLPLIGRSDAMQDVYRVITRVMNTELTVLIEGAPGTGKELAARAIHDLGNRKKAQFLSVGLAWVEAFAATPSELDAVQAGTLYLDEVEELTPEAQLKLVTLMRSDRDLPRIIASSQSNLGELVADGRFREDLYHRLNVVRLHLPELKERKEDIAELAAAFLVRAVEQGLPEKTLSPAAVERLQLHDWPGNVRELENFILRLAALSPDAVISAEQVEADLIANIAAPTARGGDLESGLDSLMRQYVMGDLIDEENAGEVHRAVIDAVERPLIKLALQVTKGNRVRAATLLGLNRNTLRAKMNALDIAD